MPIAGDEVLPQSSWAKPDHPARKAGVLHIRITATLATIGPCNLARRLPCKTTSCEREPTRPAGDTRLDFHDAGAVDCGSAFQTGAELALPQKNKGCMKHTKNFGSRKEMTAWLEQGWDAMAQVCKQSPSAT